MLPALFRTMALATLPVACFAQLVPPDFPVPTNYKGKDYQLVPLGPGLEKVDYDAYMGSIEHIRATFGSGKWPSPGLTMEDAAKDMAGEKKQWDTRASFPFAVLTLDGKKELGSFYLRPSRKQGYDAVATYWVIKEAHDQGFHQRLVADMKSWVAAAWPFRKVAWLRVDLSPEEFAKLPNK
jgi:hypothetical protein